MQKIKWYISEFIKGTFEIACGILEVLFQGVVGVGIMYVCATVVLTIFKVIFSR